MSWIMLAVITIGAEFDKIASILMVTAIIANARATGAVHLNVT